jgi:pilus assembly protein CpaE
MVDSDKIRVLIVDDIAETRENLRKLLQFEKEVEIIGVARSGREAIDQSRESKPDVVLMDINMPDMDGITATELIRRNNTITQIVILSVQGDPNYMRRAMLAGARDFLTKPPAIDELTGAIRRAGKMAHDERAKLGMRLPGGGETGSAVALPLVSQGKVITVYSPKGGAGATTLAVNLAMTLRNEDTHVALVDGDLQFGDVAVFLNEQSKTSVVDLGARADELDPEFVDEVMLTHAPSGVKVLTAPDRPEDAESITGEQFAKVLNYLRQIFAYVLVDTDSALNDITLSALDTSDLVILLTTQEIPAIKNCRLFLDLATAMKLDRRRILFVMNRFDKRIGITPEKVGESFKQPIATVLPFDERVVIPSVNRGVPFMLGDRSKPISKGFLSLAEAIRQRLVELSAIPEGTLSNNGKKLAKR